MSDRKPLTGMETAKTATSGKVDATEETEQEKTITAGSLYGSVLYSRLLHASGISCGGTHYQDVLPSDTMYELQRLLKEHEELEKKALRKAQNKNKLKGAKKSRAKKKLYEILMQNLNCEE